LPSSQLLKTNCYQKGWPMAFSKWGYILKHNTQHHYIMLTFKLLIFGNYWLTLFLPQEIYFLTFLTYIILHICHCLEGMEKYEYYCDQPVVQ
jgi:hypothetical protein